MKTKTSVFNLLLLVLMIVFSSRLASQSSKNWWDDPKYNKPIDLGKCSLKVETVEKAESITINDGTKLTAGRKDAQLLLIKLKGNAPDFGKVSMNPALFAVNFLYNGSLRLSLAKAVGQRGKTPEGRSVDLWSNKPEDSYNLALEKKGFEIIFWVAVEVPKGVDKFWIRIPSQLDEPVKNIQ